MFCQTNFYTTLDRVLSLAIICGMGLDGGPTRHGDRTSKVNEQFETTALNCRIESRGEHGSNCVSKERSWERGCMAFSKQSLLIGMGEACSQTYMYEV